MMKATFQDYSVEFGNDNGGFPIKITQFLRNGRLGEVVHTDTPWLSVKLADGRTAVPQVQDSSLPMLLRTDDTVRIQYNNIGFTADGEPLHNWHLNLDYEIISDGNCFIGMSFEAFDFDKPALAGFTLRIPMDFGTDNDVTYEYWPRPKTFDPTGISSVSGFVRNLTEKKDRTFDWVLPSVGFDFGRKGRPSRHIEWFVEDQMALDSDPDHVETRLLWEPAGPVVEYEFQTQTLKNRPYPYYWRNKIGFTLSQTAKVRDKAPMRVYHYVDDFENLPTAAQIRKMAAEGADLLNLHECWRSDARNGGFPFDRQRFQEVVEECHRYGIRVAPYIRGDEESAKEDACGWFKYYLKKDYDGIYSDYASPWGFYEVNNEYRGGHVRFKSYYKHFKRLREETIGENGVLTVHTGPFYSGEIMNGIADGYVSGEGEHGIMLRSRRENNFFSGASAGAGALWTGAFPAYRTYRMLPFMANIGQMPFVLLGEQWKSCALALPKEPGNATFARPLWKLYGLMKDERRVRFDNDVCDETILCDSDDTGLAVFGMQDGAKLYLLSNFSESARLCSTSITLSGENMRAVKLSVSYENCGIEPMRIGDKVESELDGYGICGFLVYPENGKWIERLEEFTRPYPAKDAADLSYEEKVRNAGQSRFEAFPVHTLYLKADMPFYAGTLEIPFWKDIYSSSYRLIATDETGNQRLLGFIGKQGLTADEPSESECLWPGEETPWIALHELLSPGKYTIELRGYFGGGDASMHCHAVAAVTQEGEGLRDLTYYGELDEDRCRLTFAAQLV